MRKHFLLITLLPLLLPAMGFAQETASEPPSAEPNNESPSFAETEQQPTPTETAPETEAQQSVSDPAGGGVAPPLSPPPTAATAREAEMNHRSQVLAERQRIRDERLRKRQEIIADRKRLRKYRAVPAAVAFGGMGAGALLFVGTVIGSREGEFIPGLAWAADGIALSSLTFGPSLGRWMAGLHGQGWAFTGGRLVTSGLSLSTALMAAYTEINDPLMVFLAVFGGAATLALAIVDVATTRRAIHNYESETGTRVSLTPLIAPSLEGSALYGLSLNGHF